MGKKAIICMRGVQLWIKKKLLTASLKIVWEF